METYEEHAGNRTLTLNSPETRPEMCHDYVHPSFSEADALPGIKLCTSFIVFSARGPVPGTC